MHCVFIVLQILLLRKDYELFQLSQLLVALVFGGLTDFAVVAGEGLVIAITKVFHTMLWSNIHRVKRGEKPENIVWE